MKYLEKDDHKENNNVKINSDRSKIGFYYDEDKWKAINKNDLYKIEGANKLASYILNTFNDRVFEEFNFKNKDLYIDRLLKGDLVKFNVFKHWSRSSITINKCWSICE